MQTQWAGMIRTAGNPQLQCVNSFDDNCEVAGASLSDILSWTIASTCVVFCNFTLPVPVSGIIAALTHMQARFCFLLLLNMQHVR